MRLIQKIGLSCLVFSFLFFIFIFLRDFCGLGLYRPVVHSALHSVIDQVTILRSQIMNADKHRGCIRHNYLHCLEGLLVQSHQAQSIAQILEKLRTRHEECLALRAATLIMIDHIIAAILIV